MSPGPGVRKPGPVLLCSPSLSLVPFARTPPNLPAEAVMTVKVTAEGACGVVEGCHASRVVVVVLDTGIHTCTNELSKE